MPRAKQRTPELRDRVLQVAVSMLASDGAAAFTTRKVAERASTSTPAIYELFGDKAGLVREIFLDGFRRLRSQLEGLPETTDPLADLEAVVYALRTFVARNRVLAEVMFSRPFADFDPGADGTKAGSAVRLFIVERIRRCIDAGLIEGDATDAAHALMSLALGLAATESAGWLGTSKASVDRRWGVAIGSLLQGFSATRTPEAAR